MKVLILASSLRTAGNFAPVLAAMQARGDRLELAWVPLGGAVGEDPARLEVPIVHDGAGESRTGGSRYWSALEARMIRRGFDLVLMDDMIHWPSIELSARMNRLPHRPPLVAFQHGLYQAWSAMNKSFHADYFLCFGRRHVMNFDVAYWHRVLPVGLPKLDRIEPVSESQDGHILYVAQSAPAPEILKPLLVELEESTGLRVQIRPHPGHMGRYAALQGRFHMLDPGEDILAQIGCCKWMLTTHSTAVLEAMRMGRAAVLLPSFGLTDFGGFPGIAVDFRADKVLHALKTHQNDPAGRQRFLEEVCGGARRDATTRVLGVLDGIAGRDEQRLVGALGVEHPLNAIRALESETWGARR